jgi:hypothetical protein
MELIEHFAFEPLEMLERDIEEVPGAACGIEHTKGAEPAMERAGLLDRIAESSSGGMRHCGGERRVPFLAQRLHDRRHHKALDIGTWRIVRAELVSLDRIERALQKRSEDRRLHVVPVGLARLDQQIELLA